MKLLTNYNYPIKITSSETFFLENFKIHLDNNRIDKIEYEIHHILTTTKSKTKLLSVTKNRNLKILSSDETMICPPFMPLNIFIDAVF